MQNVGLDCAGVVGLHVHPSQKHTRNGAQNNGFFDHFQDVYRGGPKLLPRDVHGVPRGCPVRPKVDAKGCPWGAKGRPGHQKGAKECPWGAKEEPWGIKRMPRNPIPPTTLGPGGKT